MAEPLKNSFGPDVAVWIADRMGEALASFDRDRFLELALEGFDDLELTPRARHLSEALAHVLPDDRARALEVLVASLGPENEADELTGMDSFRYLPHVFFVADHGLEHFEAAMTAQYELTKRFTAEFSIRAFIERHPDATMGRLATWARDPSVHVRRLVSEGTRPRLPWAPRLRRFQADPEPVLALLEVLKDDPEEYVRRSVANNLNDISKDHPGRVVEVAADWWAKGDVDRRRLIRHGLRTLIKAGHPGALDVLGYGADSPVAVESVVVTPTEVRIGESVRIEATIGNRSDRHGEALVDFVVYFVKANGHTSPKVFKGGERSVPPGGTQSIAKTVSLKQHSTRTHHSGTHRVDVQVNGVIWPGPTFEVTS